MSLQKLSVKELKVKAKRKQSKLCPSYSKMKKTELVNYLQDSTSPTKSTWSPTKNPTIDSPYFVQRKKLKRSVRKVPRKVTQKKTSSGPYDLDNMYKQDERKYKQYKIHKKKSKNLNSMKVDQLRKKLKSLGLDTKGKKNILVERLEMQGYGSGTVSSADSIKSENSVKSVKSVKRMRPPGRAEATAAAIAIRKRATHFK